MAVWKVFVGGAADNTSEIVKSYERAYAAANPEYSCRYFSWMDRGRLRDLLNGEAKGGNVALVGHSYGGDTVFWAMGNVPQVDLLIGIDPVARFQRDWAAIRAGARVWCNVRAEPDERTRNFADTVAWLGCKYLRPPAPGTATGPDQSFVTNADHGNFAAMMRRSSAGGVSARQLLGGRSVG